MRNSTFAFLTLAVGLVTAGLLQAGGNQEPDNSRTHTVFLTAFEIKGSTSSQKLAAPTVDPAGLSQGYGYKAPGAYDPANPDKWQVASYLFNPGAYTAQVGDTIELTVFVVNGDDHQVTVADPDGAVIVPQTMWNRGREYRIAFTLEQAGIYRLICATHAPTMTANFVALP